MNDEQMENDGYPENLPQSGYRKKLHKVDASLQAIFNNSPDGIVTIDDHGLIIAFNPAAEKIFGYSRNEAIGKNVNILIPVRERDQHDGFLRAFRESGRSDIFDRHREVIGCRKNGSSFPMELTITHVDDLNLFHGIVRDLTDKKMLEREITGISEREREIIGREIHDGLGQHLTALSLLAASLDQEFEKNNIPLPDTLNVMQEQLRLASSEASALAHGLAPVPEMPHGLSDALGKFAADIQASTGIDCHFRVSKPFQFSDRSTSVQLYRIAQEAVNNAIKHAHSQLIQIELKPFRSGVVMTISDDGIGFDPSLMESAKTLGLRIMSHRAKMINYSMIIESDSSGTTITCKSMY